MWRDISNFERYREEQRGTSSKYWIKIKDDVTGRERTALYKVTPYDKITHYSNNTNYGELIYSRICNEILGVPCAKIELAYNKDTRGCLSYNVLEEIDNTDNSDGRFILIDIASLIQKIRPKFDLKDLRAKGTNEFYSLDLICEALQDQCKKSDGTLDSETYDKLKKYVVELCLVDSILGCEDRHSLNLSVGRDKSTGKLIPIRLYDNGSCLALWTRKGEIQNILDSEDEQPRVRNSITSKVGIRSKTPISFDTLENVIYNHYFDDAKDLSERIINNLTPSRVEQILESPDFDGLAPIYKKMIINEIEYNRFMLKSRYEKGKVKDSIEKLLDFDDKLIKDNVICMALKDTFTSNGLNLNGPILNKYDIEVLKELNNLPPYLLNGKCAITSDTINNLKWTIIINKLTHVVKESNPEESANIKKNKVEDFLINQFKFIPEDAQKLQKISSTYNLKDLDEDKVRFLLHGVNKYEGIGEDLLDEFLALQYTRALVDRKLGINPKSKDEYRKLEKYVNTVHEKDDIINNLLEGSNFNSNDYFDQIGITNKDDRYDILYNLAGNVLKNNIVFENVDEIKNEIFKEAERKFKGIKDNINGYLIDIKDIQDILKNTYKLNSTNEKIVILDNASENFSKKCFALGADYCVRIGKPENKDLKGYSLTFFSKKGSNLPQNVESTFIKTKKELEKRLEPRYAKSSVKLHKFGPGVDVDYVFSIGSGRASRFAINKPKEEIRKDILDLFAGKDVDLLGDKNKDFID